MMSQKKVGGRERKGFTHTSGHAQSAARIGRKSGRNVTTKTAIPAIMNHQISSFSADDATCKQMGDSKNSMSVNPPHLLIGQNIRHARKAMRWNQAKLGKYLGVTRQTILAWEQGDTPIPSDKLIQVSKLLGRPIDFFFEEEHAALRYM